MELHLLVASTDQVVDNMRRGGVATRATEPFAAGQTSDDRAWVMYAAVSAE